MHFSFYINKLFSFSAYESNKTHDHLILKNFILEYSIIS